MKYLKQQNEDSCVSEPSDSGLSSRREFMLSALGAGFGALTSSVSAGAKPPSKVSEVCTDFRAAFRSWCGLDRKEREGFQSQFVQVVGSTWNALSSEVYGGQTNAVSSFVDGLERALKRSFSNVCVKVGERKRMVSGRRAMDVYGIEVYCEEKKSPRGRKAHSIPAGLQVVVWEHNDALYPQAADERQDGQYYAYLRSQLKDCSDGAKAVKSKVGKKKLAKVLPDSVSNRFPVKKFPNVIVENDPCKGSTSSECDPRYIGWDPR